jgi:hypothetical protein
MSARALNVDPRDAEIAALKAENADLRALLPPRPPYGWICVKHAAAEAHCSGSAIYAWARRGRVMSVKVGSRVWIDPASLLSRCKLRHRFAR